MCGDAGHLGAAEGSGGWVSGRRECSEGGGAGKRTGPHHELLQLPLSPSLPGSRGTSLSVCPPPILGRRPRAGSGLRGSALRQRVSPQPASFPSAAALGAATQACGSDQGRWRVRQGGRIQARAWGGGWRLHEGLGGTGRVKQPPGCSLLPKPGLRPGGVPLSRPSRGQVGPSPRSLPARVESAPSPQPRVPPHSGPPRLMRAARKGLGGLGKGTPRSFLWIWAFGSPRPLRLHGLQTQPPPQRVGPSRATQDREPTLASHAGRSPPPALPPSSPGHKELPSRVNLSGPTRPHPPLPSH